jgi:CHAT domain-containing protein
MSLWQVRDLQTQLFMKTFYQQWLERKKTINEAFYSAQAELRQKYGNAFLWAGFVLME